MKSQACEIELGKMVADLVLRKKNQIVSIYFSCVIMWVNMWWSVVNMKKACKPYKHSKKKKKKKR